MFIGSMINNSATIAVVAGAEITGGPFTLVAFEDGAVVQADDSATPLGVLIAETDETVIAGDDITVQIKDIAKVKAGAAIAAGAPVASNASGLAITATSGKFIIGYAMEAASGANQVIAVQLTKSGYMA